MPSSRRSSRSAHNLLQSSRRSSHSPKNSTPASVSIIFAEPEQGAPLAPATQVIVSTQPCVHSNDNASTSSRRVTPKPSISSLRTFGSPVQQTDEQHEAAAPEVVMKETEDHGMSGTWLCSVCQSHGPNCFDSACTADAGRGRRRYRVVPVCRCCRSHSYSHFERPGPSTLFRYTSKSFCCS